MQAIRIPEISTLRGQDAINALNEIIKDLEKQMDKELTEKQAEILMKVANELIYCIKQEMLTGTADKYKPHAFAAFRKFEDSEEANQETCKEHRKSHHLSPPTFDENCSQENCSVDCPFR